jgi:hypothetical protein
VATSSAAAAACPGWETCASGTVTGVAVALDDVAGWGATLAEALRQTGGPLSDDERAWADDVLGTSTLPTLTW